MDKQILYDSVIEIIGGKLLPLNFKYKKGVQSFCFKRKTKNGFDEIIIGYSDYEPTFYLHLTTGKRINEIENICNLFLEPIFNVKEFGKVSGMGIIYDQSKQDSVTDVTVDNVDDLNKTLHFFSSFIEEDILPEFENYNNIQYLDNLLNSEKEIWGFRNYWINIVIAKLASNPKYNILVEKFREKLKDVSGNIHYEHHSSIYENVVKHLDTL